MVNACFATQPEYDAKTGQITKVGIECVSLDIVKEW